MYRTIALILAVAAIVFLVLWLSARTDVQEATQEFKGDLSYFRAEIANKCTFSATTTDADRRECEDILESFSDVLRDYRNLLIDETGTSTMPTTTPQGSSATTSTSTATSTRR